MIGRMVYWMVKGKQKGNAYERKIYKLLRDTFPDAEVRRSLGSGSTKDKNEESDIQFIINDVRYIIECKKGSRNYCSEGALNKYWKKLCLRVILPMPIELLSDLDEHRNEGFPILIWKEDYKPDMIMFLDYAVEAYNNIEKPKVLSYRLRTELDTWIKMKQEK